MKGRSGHGGQAHVIADVLLGAAVLAFAVWTSVRATVPHAASTLNHRTQRRSP